MTRLTAWRRFLGRVRSHPGPWCCVFLQATYGPHSRRPAAHYCPLKPPADKHVDTYDRAGCKMWAKQPTWHKAQQINIKTVLENKSFSENTFSHLTQQQQSNMVALVGETVVGTFWRHVCEVNPFTKLKEKNQKVELFLCFIINLNLQSVFMSSREEEKTYISLKNNNFIRFAFLSWYSFFLIMYI